MRRFHMPFLPKIALPLSPKKFIHGELHVNSGHACHACCHSTYSQAGVSCLLQDFAVEKFCQLPHEINIVSLQRSSVCSQAMSGKHITQYDMCGMDLVWFISAPRIKMCWQSKVATVPDG